MPLYGLVFKSAFNKEIDLDTDAIKAMLCTSAYTPNRDTHQYKSSVTNEVTGTGYTAGGATLTNVAVTYDAATNTLKFTADPITWSGSTITARYIVFYDSTPGTDATRPLIGYQDFGSDQIGSNGNFTVTPNAAGIATFSVS